MEGVVNQALCQVERARAVLAQRPAIQHKLVHTGAVHVEFVVILQLGLEVVGVEHGMLTDGAQPFRTQRQDVGVRAQRSVEVPVKAVDLADRERPIPLEIVTLVIPLDHDRLGHEGQQRLGHTDGPATGTAAAVGNGKGLVEVEVDHVNTEVAGADLAEHGVHVGTVAVHQAASVVGHPADVLDTTLEQP